MLNTFFRLDESGTTIRTELLAGLTTFLTMAYIIFVQPAVLSGTMFGLDTGMDFGSVTVATCLSAALATAIMGLWARYPIAQAPGMGENFFFVFTVIPAAAAAGFPSPWRAALGVVFVSGVLFLALSLAGLRQAIIDALSPSMKNGIAVGIGLFIAFIGMQNAGVLLKDPGTGVKLNAQFASPDLIVFFTGLLVTASLHARRVRGSILWGIAAATLLAVVLKTALPRLLPGMAASPLVAGSALMTRFQLARGAVAMPPPISPTLLKMDISAALSLPMLPFVVIFLFMDVFDTVGTLIGVSEQAGWIRDNRLPRAGRVMLSDASGTVVGACLGTSTVTSFIESAAGVEQGGRTGLTALTVSALFLLSLFLSPVIAMIGSYPAITAPALVVVGAMMMQNVRKIDWSDYGESIPAFLAMAGIPFTFSIADGLALGFISYPIVKLLSGRGRDVNLMMIGLAAILIVYFALVRGRLV